MKFLVVSVGYDNCEPNELTDQIGRCIASVSKQIVNTEVQHVIMVDGAKSNGQLITKDLNIYYQTARHHALRNIIKAIEMHYFNIDKDDVICLLDLDDELYTCHALDIVRKFYLEDSETLLTYGSYKTKSGKPSRFCSEYKYGESIRMTPWRASHLKTFKRKLWDHLPINHCMDDDGEWLEYAADLAIMMPLMESAGINRCKFIPHDIYLYNDQNPMNEHKVDAHAQKMAEHYIRTRRPLQKAAI